MLTRRHQHLERSVEPAEALPDPALRIGSEQGDRHREAALHNNLAAMLHRAGHESESMQHLRRAVTIFAEVGDEDGGTQPEVWRLVEG